MERNAEDVKYVAYIESTGTQYIDTQYVPTERTSFEFEAAFNKSDYSSYYGAITRESGTYRRMHAGYVTISNVLTIHTSSVDNNDTITLSNDCNYHKFLISNELCMIDSIKKENNELIVPTVSLYLFDRNTGGLTLSQRISLSRCTYCKIYESEILVRHFLPCLDKNGIPCMYEKVEGKYYYNDGTGQFLYGTELIGY